VGTGFRARAAVATAPVRAAGVVSDAARGASAYRWHSAPTTGLGGTARAAFQRAAAAVRHRATLARSARGRIAHALVGAVAHRRGGACAAGQDLVALIGDVAAGCAEIRARLRLTGGSPAAIRPCTPAEEASGADSTAQRAAAAVGCCPAIRSGLSAGPGNAPASLISRGVRRSRVLVGGGGPLGSGIGTPQYHYERHACSTEPGGEPASDA